jgi:hypothetical protein
MDINLQVRLLRRNTGTLAAGLPELVYDGILYPERSEMAVSNG